MPTSEVRTLLKNLDQRVGTIEQKLPTLATKDELRSELETALKAYATKDDLRDFGNQLRLEMKILFEEQWEKIKGLFDGYRHHDKEIENHGARLDGHDRQIGGLDLRMKTLERRRLRP